MAGYILLVLVKEFFYYFTGIKLRLFSKKSKKNQNAETPTRDQPSLQHTPAINPTT